MLKVYKKYKPGEFADMLGVSIDTLRRWDKSGKLKAARYPSNVRYYTHEQYLLIKHSAVLDTEEPCVLKVTDDEVDKVLRALRVLGLVTELYLEAKENRDKIYPMYRVRPTLYLAEELDKLGIVSWVLSASSVLSVFDDITVACILLLALTDTKVRESAETTYYGPTEGTRVMWAVNCIQYASELTVVDFNVTLELVHENNLLKWVLENYGEDIDYVAKGIRCKFIELGYCN